MNVNPVLSVVIAGGVVAVWLTAAATSNNRDVARPPAATTAPLDADGAKLAKEIARLHEQLRPTAAPRHSRNLFQFAAPKTRPVAPPELVAPALGEPPPVPPPARPSLRLIGIAEDQDANGPVRTAILSGPGGQVLLVKEGDPATPRYRVGRITGDVVELTDANDGSVVRLALR